MSEPRVIGAYLTVLAAELPAPIVEELADGLAETYQSYRRQGLAPDQAAESAVAEFGDPHVIAAEFARVNPARRGARRLLLTGPAVGGCWAAVLITGRAWAWPIPLLARIGFRAGTPDRHRAAGHRRAGDPLQGGRPGGGWRMRGHRRDRYRCDHRPDAREPIRDPGHGRGHGGQHGAHRAQRADPTPHPDPMIHPYEGVLACRPWDSEPALPSG